MRFYNKIIMKIIKMRFPSNNN